MGRRSLAVSAERGFGFPEADTMPMLSRRSVQMLFVFDVVSGVILPLTATRPRDPGVLSAPRNTPQETTAARLRAAEWEEAVTMCPHTTAKCANCGGPHGARADACQAKRIAQHAARGWRSPPPPRREKKEAPGAEAPGVEEGGPEVESVAEAEGEGMEE